ncbi:hypothetical protein pipiens_000885, partial [Culex pipiens pipiens]
MKSTLQLAADQAGIERKLDGLRPAAAIPDGQKCGKSDLTINGHQNPASQNSPGEIDRTGAAGGSGTTPGGSSGGIGEIPVSAQNQFAWHLSASIRRRSSSWTISLPKTSNSSSRKTLIAIVPGRCR